MPAFPYTQALLQPDPSFITASEGGILTGPFGPPMPVMQNKDNKAASNRQFVRDYYMSETRFLCMLPRVLLLQHTFSLTAFPPVHCGAFILSFCDQEDTDA